MDVFPQEILATKVKMSTKNLLNLTIKKYITKYIVLLYLFFAEDTLR